MASYAYIFLLYSKLMFQENGNPSAEMDKFYENG